MNACRIARAATNVILRSLSTSLVMEEMYRGTPVIYVDYTDYDEIAHHSGPERTETLEALDGVDATVRSLVRAAEDTPRPYKFLLLSDHGQSLGATFRQLTVNGFAPLVRDVTDRKPAAHVFVDDRAVCFRGDFAATLNEIDRFAAHWEGQ